MTSLDQPRSRGRNVLENIIGDLRPYDGRLEMAAHIALLCGLTAVIAMAFRVPEALLSCYLIFLMYRDNAGENIFLGVGMIIVATIIIPVVVLLFSIVGDDPMLRLLAMAAITFGGMWLSRASKLGEEAGLLSFIIVFILTFYDYIGIPELVARSLAWLWIIVFLPMALLVVLNIFIGRSPRELVRKKLRERLLAVQRLEEGADTEQANLLLREGNEGARTHVKMARLLGQVSTAEQARLEAELSASFEQLAAAHANAVSVRHPFPALQPVADGAVPSFPQSGETLAGATHTGTDTPDPARSPVQAAPKSQAFLAPDAFSNPDHVRFALKALLAIFITYVFYTSIGLFEIHTAMITCFLVALGTSGETFRKSILRIVGCLIGTVLGVFSVVVISPYLIDSGHLFLLITAGSFIAGWVSMGSYRIQYAGFQIALAFFICVLPGSPLDFGPNVNLSDAGYRILGILIGIIIMGVVFSSIWPVSATTVQEEEMTSSLRAMAAFLRGEETLEPAHRHLAEARHNAEAAAFEGLGRLQVRPSDRDDERLSTTERLLQILPLVREAQDAPRLAAALDQVTGSPREIESLQHDLEPQDFRNPISEHAFQLVRTLAGKRNDHD